MRPAACSCAGRRAVAALVAVELLTIIFLDLATGRVSSYSRAGQIAYALINITLVSLLVVAALPRGCRVISAALILYGVIGATLYASAVPIDHWVKLLLGS